MFQESSDAAPIEPSAVGKSSPDVSHGDAAAESSDLRPPQELTLSYLRDSQDTINNNNNNLIGNKLAIERSSKGKEVETSEAPQWIERDFLQLAGIPSNRDANPDRRLPESSSSAAAAAMKSIKKPRIESAELHLSLAPPDLSLSLNPNPPPVPARRAHSAAATTGNSEDFSYSMFSHNPSCSLTRNSTENFESEQFLHCGEGTNGSVHSRFRPFGDGNTITFANNSKETVTNGFCRANVSEATLLFPSELPARPVGFKVNGGASFDSGRNMGVARPERLLREIVSESMTTVSQVLNELPNEVVENVKDFLRNLVSSGGKNEELLGLQRRLELRSDLTAEMLGKCNRLQLEILVAVKTGNVDFISVKNRLSDAEIVEVFLQRRCKNINCKNVLPVDDCDCNICSTKKGFCSACMCPVCLKFDCAGNTCIWVGCDVCSHWCHAVCGIEKNLIRPGPSLKGSLGTTEMQFHCLGCDHASEMFGFVKEVFTCCAKDWDPETFKKELDCVRKIFHASEDFEGKSLHGKAEEMLTMLNKKMISPENACNGMLQFFKYGVADLSVTGRSSKGIFTAQASQQGDVLPTQPSMTTIIPTKSTFSLKPSSSLLDTRMDAPKSEPRVHISEPHFSLPKKEEQGFQSLETMIRLKEEEAKLYQRHADEARRESESYRQIARAKAEKIEEEYATKIAKLCLQETQERRRRKLEELKFLENSHCDYQKMKLRMQAEIASLLERMEATRKQWV